MTKSANALILSVGAEKKAEEERERGVEIKSLKESGALLTNFGRVNSTEFRFVPEHDLQKVDAPLQQRRIGGTCNN